MDIQEAFDRVWQHFIVEKNPPSYAKDEEEEGQVYCRYRSPEGAKCAFGILLPDEYYEPDFEERIAASVIESSRELHDLFPDVQFYVKLQSCHDEPILFAYRENAWDFHGSMEQKMRRLARNYNLKIPGES